MSMGNWCVGGCHLHLYVLVIQVLFVVQLCMIQSSFDVNEIRVLLDSYYPPLPPVADLDSQDTQAIHQTPIISDPFKISVRDSPFPTRPDYSSVHPQTPIRPL